MHKEDIANLLEEKYSTLLNWLEHHDDEKWTYGPDNKWTTGQQALHLLKTIKPLNDILSMPAFMFKYTLGSTDRRSRDYDILVQDFLELLNQYNEHPSKPPKTLKIPKLKDKRYILTRLQVESKKLQYKIHRLSDENLDTLVLPHPIMGRMPLREALMLTAYHVEHHTRQLQANY